MNSMHMKYKDKPEDKRIEICDDFSIVLSDFKYTNNRNELNNRRCFAAYRDDSEEFSFNGSDIFAAKDNITMIQYPNSMYFNGNQATFCTFTDNPLIVPMLSRMPSVSNVDDYEEIIIEGSEEDFRIYRETNMAALNIAPDPDAWHSLGHVRYMVYIITSNFVYTCQFFMHSKRGITKAVENRLLDLLKTIKSTHTQTDSLMQKPKKSSATKNSSKTDISFKQIGDDIFMYYYEKNSSRAFTIGLAVERILKKLCNSEENGEKPKADDVKTAIRELKESCGEEVPIFADSIRKLEEYLNQEYSQSEKHNNPYLYEYETEDEEYIWYPDGGSVGISGRKKWESRKEFIENLPITIPIEGTAYAGRNERIEYVSVGDDLILEPLSDCPYFDDGKAVEVFNERRETLGYLSVSDGIETIENIAFFKDQIKAFVESVTPLSQRRSNAKYSLLDVKICRDISKLDNKSKKEIEKLDFNTRLKAAYEEIHRGEHYLENGQNEKARKSFETAIKYDEDNNRAICLAARTFTSTNILENLNNAYKYANMAVETIERTEFGCTAIEEFTEEIKYLIGYLAGYMDKFNGDNSEMNYKISELSMNFYLSFGDNITKYNDSIPLETYDIGVKAWMIGLYYYSKCSGKEDLQLLNTYTEKIRTRVPAFSPNNLKLEAIAVNEVDDYNKKTDSNQNSSGGCYIATCVYGSYDCPQLWTLRRYRDDTLAKTWYGRAFIHTYYAISPTLVKWFGNTKWFKKMWQGKLDYMVEKLQSEGIESTPYNDINW